MKPWFKYERIPGPLASSYAKASRMVIDGYYSQVADEIISYIRQGSMLDLGTGPGYLPIEIVNRAPEIHITGVDLSRKLIHMARLNAQKVGFASQLNFEVGNSSRLRFDDDSFDMVISTGMLHSLKKPVSVLKEINRVLKLKWKASLNLRERFFLWIFGWLGLHKPIAVYRKNDVTPMLEAVGFKKYEVDEREGEIRIKVTK